MLLVEVKDGKIGKALKTLKRKWDKTKAMKELRERKEFIKNTDKKRTAKSRAAYIQKKYRSND